MHKPQKQVSQFHYRIKAPGNWDIPDSYVGLNHNVPKAHIPDRAELRARLIAEECAELLNALTGEEAQIIVGRPAYPEFAISVDKHTKPDLEDTIDGMCDLLVVTYGTAEEMHVDLEPHFDEVHRANMDKVGGPVREDGKQLKPDNWKGPDHASILKGV